MTPKTHRWLTGLVAVTALGVPACGDDAAPDAAHGLVPVESQTCDRPQTRHGVGLLLADGLALTAAHVVDDELRHLEFDGHAASVIAMSTETDLALVASDVAGAGPRNAAVRWFATIDDAALPDIDAPQPVTIRSVRRSQDTTVERVVTLRVDDLSADAVHERRALVLAMAAAPGDSGSPVIDASGDVIGVVTLRRSGLDESYATRIPSVPNAADLAADLGRSTTVSVGTNAQPVARVGACT